MTETSACTPALRWRCRSVVISMIIVIVTVAMIVIAAATTTVTVANTANSTSTNYDNSSCLDNRRSGSSVHVGGGFGFGAGASFCFHRFDDFDGDFLECARRCASRQLVRQRRVVLNCLRHPLRSREQGATETLSVARGRAFQAGPRVCFGVTTYVHVH